MIFTKFTAYRSDEEPWRLSRLARAHAFACGVMSTHPACPSIDEVVLEMHDHKGFVNIRWRVHPTQAMKKAFADAWDHVGEVHDAMEHVVEIWAAPACANACEVDGVSRV